MSLFQALSGAHPWRKHSTMGEVLVAICTAPIPLLQDRAPWIEPGLAEVVHRAMTRLPDDRFQSVAELAAALEPFAEGTPVIFKKDLRAVSRHERSEVKPRATGIAAGEDATVADRTSVSEGSASVEQQSGVTGSLGAQSLAAQPSRLGSKLALGAAAVAVAAAFAFLLLREPAPAEQPVASAASAAPSSPEHQVAVKISPPEAEVTVDGKRYDLGAGGLLRLSGRPGTSFAVVLALNGRRLERPVVITTEGEALPSRLELDTTPPSAASAAAAVSATASAEPESASSRAAAPQPRAAQPREPAPTGKPAPTAPKPTAPPAPTGPPIRDDNAAPAAP